MDNLINSELDKKEQEEEEQLLFMALKESNKAIQDHLVPRYQLNEYFKGKTRDDRNAYFRKEAALTREAHQAFLDAFPRLKTTRYTERSIAEQRHLLEDEYIKVQHEIQISKLVYSLMGCDSWEDMFRDNVPRLEEKCEGIRLALEQLVGLDDDDCDFVREGAPHNKESTNRHKGKYAWKGIPPNKGEPTEKTVDGKKYLYCPHHGDTKWVLEINPEGVPHKTGCVKMATDIAARKHVEESRKKKKTGVVSALMNAIEEDAHEEHDEDKRDETPQG